MVIESEDLAEGLLPNRVNVPRAERCRTVGRHHDAVFAQDPDDERHRSYFEKTLFFFISG